MGISVCGAWAGLGGSQASPHVTIVCGAFKKYYYLCKDLNSHFFFFSLQRLFIYFWLRWVFVAVRVGFL